MAVTIERHLDDELRATLLAMYSEAFEPLRTLTATKQTLDDSEFIALFDHDATSTLLARRRCGEITGFAVAVSDLGLIPWLNPEYFRECFPDHYTTGRISYIAALVVAPAHQGGTTFASLVREITVAYGPSNSVIAMDCCLHNSEQVQLPGMIDKVANRYQRTLTHELDRQTYWAFELTGGASG